MEVNILDVLGLQLVDYFINFEEYQPFNIPAKYREDAKGKVYLVNKNNTKYQLIKIIKQDIFNTNEIKAKDDHIIVALKKDLKISDNNFKILVVAINDENQNEFRQSPTVDIIITTPSNVIKELAKIFPSISKTINLSAIEEYEEKKSDETESEVFSEREKNWKKVNFQNRRFLKDALLKSTNPHLIATWIFFALPIVFYVVFTILISSNANIFAQLNSSNILNLVFGASNRNIIFSANQYWRWLTYPLVNLDYRFLLFYLWMFYRVGRYIEGFYGLWKAIIIWISAIFLTGIIQTTVDHVNILDGFMILSLISIGAMIPIIWNYRLFKSKIMGKLVITFILLMIFWMFINGMRAVILLYWMIGIGSGWLFGALVSYHNRKLTLFYAFSPVAIGLLLLFTILVAFLNPYYHYDNNNLTFETLNVYKSFNLVGQNFISWVMSHYFGVII